MAVHPKLTPAQVTTLLALATGRQCYEATYRPIAKLMSLGYAERKLVFGKGPFSSFTVWYHITPAGTERAQQIQASKDAAGETQIP